MSQTDCSYCALAMKKGQLFCSRHGSDMTGLKSGIFYINANSFDECDWHVTRLSLNFNLDDKQIYRAGHREFSISPEKYLLLNKGQSFKTSAKSSIPNRMVTLAFEVGLAEKLFQDVCATGGQFLDNPFTIHSNPIEFFEKIYQLDQFVHDSVVRLMELTDAQAVEQAMEDLLLKIICDQMNIRKEILSISKFKVSTRVEVYKRLHWSLDYLHDHFASDLTVEQLAAVACLSPFHYKRLFTAFFKISPYQYLIRHRLEKACSLLKTDSKVSEVCRQVGWKDPSSFCRLFKRKFSFTPEQFRNRAVNS